VSQSVNKRNNFSENSGECTRKYKRKEENELQC
jgi:hypothetical protein